jgi:sulfatase maturation enzyme AslB (radical SAM superfamily)
MKPLDPPWILTWLYVLLRQFERGLGGGWKKTTVARFGDLLQPLTYALMRLSVPRANNPWFTDAEAKAAEQEKRELLKALGGQVQAGARGSKPHIGQLSPGCTICMDGYWGCNYINGRCQKRCFYCTQSQTVDRKSRSDGFTFESPSEHVSFLKAFHVEGVGFSGGEPLMALDRLCGLTLTATW